MAPTEISMALQIKKWPNIFSTSGAIVPTTSFAFLGPAGPHPVKGDSGDFACMCVSALCGSYFQWPLYYSATSLASAPTVTH